MRKKIIVLGRNGSGKDTQAQMISDAYGIERVSSGDILIDMSMRDERILQMLGNGYLFPDEMMNDIVLNALDPTGFVLTGYPRTLPQAGLLDERMRLDMAIYIDVPEEVCRYRMQNRVICGSCGMSYSKANIQDACPKDGGELLTRNDDSDESAIRKRFDEYREKTERVVDHYLGKGVLVSIHPGPEDSPRKVFSYIRSFLG